MSEAASNPSASSNTSGMPNSAATDMSTAGGSSGSMTNGSSRSNGRGRGGRGGRCGNNQGGYHNRNGTKFKGKCDELGSHVYDIADTGENKELFATTTREIAEYVARTYDNASEFRLGLVNTELETIVAPEALDADAGMGAIE